MIEPLNLPNAAGVEFAEGDVRHLATGDELSHVAISLTSRNLANRDNLIGSKVNELVTAVNNKEQLVNLPAFRTTVAPSVTEILTNYRIPDGYEARVINATIATVPQTQCRLDIFHSADTFGNSTGTNVVSTLTEFTGEVKFYPTGEFIASVTNISGVSATVIVSIVVSMRPLTDQAGNLLTTGIPTKKGDVGPQGSQGSQGNPGNAGAGGSPGMVWMGMWASGTLYNPTNVVGQTTAGVVSSYIARQASLNIAPPNATYWDVVAGGSQGPQGVSGANGSGSTVNVQLNTVGGTLTTGGNYYMGAGNDGFAQLPTGTTYASMTEGVFHTTSGTTQTLAWLKQQIRLNFAGTVNFGLPLAAYGASSDWHTNEVDCVATTCPGLSDVSPAAQPNAEVLKPDLNTFMVVQAGTTPRNVALEFIGMKGF